jgi:hypothetical protein
VPETGRIVYCDEQSDLAATVAELLDNREALEQMGNAARQWTVERFDSASVIAQAARLFKPQTAAASRVQSR